MHHLLYFDFLLFEKKDFTFPQFHRVLVISTTISEIHRFSFINHFVSFISSGFIRWNKYRNFVRFLFQIVSMIHLHLISMVNNGVPSCLISRVLIAACKNTCSFSPQFIWIWFLFYMRRIYSLKTNRFETKICCNF